MVQRLRPGRPPHRRLRLIKQLASWPLALIILFEEWGWQPLQRVFSRLIRRLGLSGLEAWIGRRSPYAALALFALPSVALVPVKLLALGLMGHGHILLGTAVVVAAKIGGTAVVARLFTLTQPALMRLAWFARLYQRWTVWKNSLLAHVRSSWVWRWARGLRRRWMRGLRRF